MSLRRPVTVAMWLWLVGVSGTASAQLPIPGAQGTTPPAAAVDPLNRDTPFGAITGFSAAARRGEIVVAGEYLQARGKGPQEIEGLVRELSDLLDRYYTQPLTALSRTPAGNMADGLDPDRERIPLTIGTRSVDLFLTRVTDPVAGSVWLISADSLARVPALVRSPADTWVERVMPATLVERAYFGISLAQWILWAVSIALPLVLFWALAHLVAWMGRRRIEDITRRALFIAWWNGVRWLIVFGLALGLHFSVMPLLGFSLTFRVAYARVGLTVAVVVVALLVWQLMSVSFHQARLLAMRRGRSDTQSLILLGERIAKVLLVVIAVFVLLGLAGIDATAALAGVGIIGVAVALGAQKSVENLIGGVFLITDRALAVGDQCRLSDREGWVEDVTLRSVRLRTIEQTLLSVPAGVLSQASIENFSTRSKILLQSILRLRYGTTSAQIETVLQGVRQLLASHALLDKDSARIRLVAFGPQAIELELFTYVATSDGGKFLEVRESLLLQVAQIVESSGSAFAVPVQFASPPNDATSSGSRFQPQASA